jgi:hypothetical protein
MRRRAVCAVAEGIAEQEWNGKANQSLPDLLRSDVLRPPVSGTVARLLPPRAEFSPHLCQALAVQCECCPWKDFVLFDQDMLRVKMLQTPRLG